MTLPAPEGATRDLRERRSVPRERSDSQGLRVALVHVETLRLTRAMWSRATEAGGCGENERAGSTALGSLELSKLGDRRLMHVTADDELCAGFGERRQSLAAPTQRALSSGTPGRCCQVVVESHDP